MNKNKLTLIVAAIVFVAAVLVLIFSLSPSSVSFVVDDAADYGNVARQKGNGVLVTLEKNGHDTYDWVPGVDEFTALDIKDKSSEEQGIFLISGDSSTNGGDVTFRLTNKNADRCIYQFVFHVYRDEDDKLSIGAKEHIAYGEEHSGGDGTEFPYIYYAEGVNALIIEVMPTDGMTKAWTTQADEDVFAVQLQTEGESADTFQIFFESEEEKEVKLCRNETDRALSMVVGRDDDGFLYIKSSEVTDYTLIPFDSSVFDSDREAFQAKYGSFTLPEGAKEEAYEFDSVKRGMSENITYPCASMKFVTSDGSWNLLSAVDVSLNDFSEREKSVSDSTTTKTILGVEVVIYTIEDNVCGFWTKNGTVYSISGMGQTIETMTRMVQTLMGQ